MLYYLINYLEEAFQPPGFQIVQFSTVRASLAAITALVISLYAGRYIIKWLSRKQLGEQVREGIHAGAVDHTHKQGTPSMGGLIILVSVLGATLLWGAIAEVYVWLIMVATAWMGAFGFADDYIKIVKRNKSGLPARIKVTGQITLGLLVGSVLYFHPQFAETNTLTYLPFVAGETLDYDVFRYFVTDIDLGWLIYIPVVIFILTALSNAVNLTDGLDGLAAGVTGIVAVGLTALTFIAGNEVFSEFLTEMQLPGAGELTIFAAALAASCFGFLWYNGYPATVFMGDTGSLALGAAIGTMTLMIKKELLLPLLCAVFFFETISVIIQTTWFKYTRKKTGTGKRVFLMAPIHHHYEAGGTHEAKIVLRFWLITAVTVIATLLVLRIR
uniref:Putative glycosyl transferase n=1 Tax=uncultured marine microorganism HF4000_APKG2M17 TaxID=455548 RepID=B3T6U1_9ZZZZ|nr:putative glycosyl transferase [uncultured marine microorganism HF4000_APKG2M17]